MLERHGTPIRLLKFDFKQTERFKNKQYNSKALQNCLNDYTSGSNATQTKKQKEQTVVNNQYHFLIVFTEFSVVSDKGSLSPTKAEQPIGMHNISGKKSSFKVAQTSFNT